LLLNELFPIVDTCHNCEDMARQNCAMVPRWRFFGEFLGPAFPASRVQHISDLHSKFAQECIMCRSMVDIHSATAEIKRGKKEEIKKQDKNIMSASATQGGHDQTCNQATVRETTGCPPVSSPIQVSALRFFWHVTQTDSKHDRHQVSIASLRPRVAPAGLQSANIGIHSAWRMTDDLAYW